MHAHMHLARTFETRSRQRPSGMRISRQTNAVAPVCAHRLTKLHADGRKRFTEINCLAHNLFRVNHTNTHQHTECLCESPSLATVCCSLGNACDYPQVVCFPPVCVSVTGQCKSSLANCSPFAYGQSAYAVEICTHTHTHTH